MTNNNYQKHKKSSKKKHANDIKIFLKKKKAKGEKYKNLTQKEKEKKHQYHQYISLCGTKRCMRN